MEPMGIMMLETSSLDILLDSASEVANLVVPILIVILLFVAILLVRKIHATMGKVDRLIEEGEKTIESAKRQIDALDAPLRTIESVSETVDIVHDASKNAIRSTIGLVADNISGFRDKFNKEKSDEVVANFEEEITKERVDESDERSK